MNIRQSMSLILLLAMLTFSCVNVKAQEPTRPAVDSSFDDALESTIQQLTTMAVSDVFEKAKSIEFINNEDLLHKAIFVAFNDRKAEAINFALNRLQLRKTEFRDGKLITRTEDFYIIKKLFQVFPEEAARRTLEVYNGSSVIMKSNIVECLGLVAGGDSVRNLLVNALEDQTFYEEENEEMDGIPMRICDMAYNQLVLRYEIKDVLRVIGPTHKIEVRDYHIDILKNKLSVMPQS
ncbi:MAG: hypothetical protein L6416_04180 [Candidatus Omnitrophica bacterium]|nr:hypothetical protein [Candidatus Omnitrophota bacterium]